MIESQPRLLLPKYSFGVGDRFGHQGAAQLRACQLALEQGITVIPVWNKSHREHTIIGTDPSSQRAEADSAVRQAGWTLPYFVDADHISLHNVEPFLPHCDFFTLDVAEDIGKPVEPQQAADFVRRHPELKGTVEIEGLPEPLRTTEEQLQAIAGKYLAAVQQAGRIYRFVRERKGGDTFVTEVSMDETETPQTPLELLVILAAMADEGIPAQTIAPRFSGRFNKGVDYAGDVEQFAREFAADVAVVQHAVRVYGFPGTLKLSVHSGSDKFSLYRPIHQVLQSTGAGLHLKTAGTTWLEEVAGLAESGGEALELARHIYAEAYARRQELCAPYAAVIDIDPARLPSPEEVARWTAEQFIEALEHAPGRPGYNPHFRQLLHVGYKIAAQLGPRYHQALEAHRERIGRRVTANLYERHIKPLFVDGSRNPVGG